MKAKILFSFTTALFLAGCATPPKTDVYTYRDNLGPGVDLIMDNELESEGDRTALVWLNASRIREGAWGAKYYLEVRYECVKQAGWLDIGPGETLILTVDGQTVRFRGVGSLNTRRETSGGTLVEHAIYEAKVDDLRKIARAKEVKVEIIGRARTAYREFKPANVQKFRNFVLTYMGF
jgi:hypothetical protein